MRDGTVINNIHAVLRWYRMSRYQCDTPDGHDHGASGQWSYKFARVFPFTSKNVLH